LTKVFVVLLVVFSITFTVMTVSVVAQTANWRETALRYEQHAVVADTNLRHLIASSAADLATARDAVKAHLESIRELQGDLQDSRNSLAQLRAELAKAASENSSAEAPGRSTATSGTSWRSRASIFSGGTSTSTHGSTS
jgi:cell shape-determining protein MreC